MSQPIPGVSPPQLSEVTVMTVWPSIAATGLGRMLGRLYLIPLGFRIFGVPLTIGRLLALASIPIVVPWYFLMRLPRVPFVILGIKNPMSWRYRLTNRRLIVENPFGGGEIKAVSLDRFDAIDVVVEPGQAWYPAGDLVFRRGQTETFRIWGVPRPETFRQTCMKAHLSFVGVQKSQPWTAAV